jgi:hypothetical protein
LREKIVHPWLILADGVIVGGILVVLFLAHGERRQFFVFLPFSGQEKELHLHDAVLIGEPSLANVTSISHGKFGGDGRDRTDISGFSGPR